MYKCLLYGTGYQSGRHINLIKYFEIIEEIVVVGIAARDKKYSKLFGYNFVEKEDINNIEFDIVVVMTDDKFFREIEQDLIKMGVNEKCIIPCKALKLYEFSFEKYIALKGSRISIFSINCWGAYTYKSLGLKYNSPFIWFWMSDYDFLKFLKQPKYYLKQDIMLQEYRYVSQLNREYPVGKCDDIVMHFNHYVTIEDAKVAWDKRKDRINWDNIFVMMYTNDPLVAEEFSELPYEKKICFTSLLKDEGCICNVSNICGFAVEDVNRIAKGEVFLYNRIDLLLDGMPLQRGLIRNE